MGEGRREKEGGKKQPHLPWFSFPSFPCAGQWDVGYCFRLAQRQDKMAVQRGEQGAVGVVLYSRMALKISKSLPTGHVFLSPQSFLSLLSSLRMGHLLCGSNVAPPGTCTGGKSVQDWLHILKKHIWLLSITRSCKRERWKGNTCSFAVVPSTLCASDKVHLSISAK